MPHLIPHSHLACPQRQLNLVHRAIIQHVYARAKTLIPKLNVAKVDHNNIRQIQMLRKVEWPCLIGLFMSNKVNDEGHNYIVSGTCIAESNLPCLEALNVYGRSDEEPSKFVDRCFESKLQTPSMKVLCIISIM